VTIKALRATSRNDLTKNSTQSPSFQYGKPSALMVDIKFTMSLIQAVFVKVRWVNMDFYVGYLAGHSESSGHLQMTAQNAYDLENILKFDLLSISLREDRIVFTITGALLYSSNSILMKYDDFWKSRNLGIIFAPKYKSIQKYVSDRMTILDKSLANIENNYEYKNYTSKHIALFTEYLKSKLGLAGTGKRGFICHRTTNADTNFRTSFQNELSYNDSSIYRQLNSNISHREYSSILSRLIDLANDKSFFFQRATITSEILSEFPNAGNVISSISTVANDSYNKAMALSVNASYLSNHNERINGRGLISFLFHFDNELYNEIRTLTPRQIFLLASQGSWRLFVQAINNFYAEVRKMGVIYQDTNFAKLLVDNIQMRNTVLGTSDFFLTLLFCLMGIPTLNSFFLRKCIDESVDNNITSLFSKSSDFYDYAIEVQERIYGVRTIVNDILLGNYD
jgi:hypothetical protein